MKDKISILIATLIFGSNFSYASEKKEKNYHDNISDCITTDDCCLSCNPNEGDFGYIDYDLWGISNEAPKLGNSLKVNNTENFIENKNYDVDFGHIDYNLWDINNQAPNFNNKNNINVENKNTNSTNALNNYQIVCLYLLPTDTFVIPIINVFDTSGNDYLKKFTNNPAVLYFKDCLGREYKNVHLSTITSRLENIIFASELTYSDDEKSQLLTLANKITEVYTKYFPPKGSAKSGKSCIKFSRDENQIEKTKLIHFIEDLFAEHFLPSGSSCFYTYNKLIAVLNFLYHYNHGIYSEAILQAWDAYINPNNPKKLKLFTNIKKEDFEILKLKLNFYMENCYSIRYKYFKEHPQENK